MSKQTLLKLMLAKASVLGLIYLGAVYHRTINRVADNLVYKSVPVQDGFFTDYNGFGIETKLNEQGKKEPHLVYENKFSVPLTYENLEDIVEVKDEKEGE